MPKGCPDRNRVLLLRVPLHTSCSAHHECWSIEPLYSQQNQGLAGWALSCIVICAATQQEVTTHDPYQSVSQPLQPSISRHDIVRYPGDSRFCCLGQDQLR